MIKRGINVRIEFPIFYSISFLCFEACDICFRMENRALLCAPGTVCPTNSDPRFDGRHRDWLKNIFIFNSVMPVHGRSDRQTWKTYKIFIFKNPFKYEIATLIHLNFQNISNYTWSVPLLEIELKTHRNCVTTFFCIIRYIVNKYMRNSMRGIDLNLSSSRFIDAIDIIHFCMV